MGIISTTIERLESIQFLLAGDSEGWISKEDSFVSGSIFDCFYAVTSMNDMWTQNINKSAEIILRVAVILDTVSKMLIVAVSEKLYYYVCGVFIGAGGRAKII